ncbi:isoleucine--tRNA ligase [Maudiozyma humilis]|uniref:Isoleucine--tRNA ligase, mitochondrial n=1 Tax=Maudiozyma humilis TaxID=51915 RepID=A0AAV5S160_MAUHU|nr:isoleucine--tRNA ligase [Kazachstania humilis]
MLRTSHLRIIRRQASSHSFQKTLNLPSTKFPVRSNLQKTYKELIPQSSQDVYARQLTSFYAEYDKIRDRSEGERLKFIKDKLFVLHDGPPYANGDLHLGHALNKILKDIINRYQMGQGKYVYYRPGWDCHGLPIELKALKKLSSDQIEQISPIKIRNIAAKHAAATQKKQREQFEKFGIMTDWTKPYMTMDPGYEVDQLNVFKKLYDFGLIKRQNKPVYWGTETRTALAEGELEYNENHKSVSAYVNFPLTAESVSELRSKLRLDNITAVDCLIWTSTPWTLFSNQAICFNERFDYSLIKVEGRQKMIIVGTDLQGNVGLPEEHMTVATFNGSILNGLKYTNPLLNSNKPIEYPLINGSHVTNSAGTGLVHTAPGHGADDYLVGSKNGLPVFSPVDHKGNYDLSKFPENSSVQDLLLNPEGNGKEGRNVLDPTTTSMILQELEKLGMLMKTAEITHSYPYDWRSKKPIIIRSTPQWFTNLEDLKKLAAESLDNVQFMPQRGKQRLSSFIKNRNEWCISRQRSWGVPIPYFQHKEKPDLILMDSETISLAIENIKKWGLDSWFLEEDPAHEKTNIKNWLPPKYQHLADQYRKGKDTMDVWFDSGSSWTTLVDFYHNKLNISHEGMPKPLADMYLEGSDQHRGWFQSSLLCKIASNEKAQAPYGAVVTHGFTLDEKGIKMSKSIGNTIAPTDVIEGNKKLGLPALGVDGLRYLIAQSDFTSDITAGPTIMQHSADALKKIRLCFKFLLGNLNSEAVTSQLPIEELAPIDKYMIAKLQQLLDESKRNYTDYNFSKVLSTLQYHLNNELSAFYFDISKDTLYSNSVNSLRRRQVQTTLHKILETYTSILYPIIPVMVHEVYNFLPGESAKSGVDRASLDTKIWPSYSTQVADAADIVRSFEQVDLKILSTFKDMFKSISNETITKPGQTIAKLYVTEDLPITSESLMEILQVADAEIIKVDELDTVDIADEHPVKIPDVNAVLVVEESSMHKCPRCWKHSSPDADSLCGRCEHEIDASKSMN